MKNNSIILSLAFAIGNAGAWTLTTPSLPPPSTLSRRGGSSSSTAFFMTTKKQLPGNDDNNINDNSNNNIDDEEISSPLGRRTFFKSTAIKGATAISLLVASSSSSSTAALLSPAIANAASGDSTTYSKVYQPPPHSMDNKIVLITGGNAGLGLESTKRLAAAGATVVFTSRDELKGKKSVDEINDYLGRQKEVADDPTFAGKIVMTTLDLCDLENVKSFKDRLVTALGGEGKRGGDDYAKIDVLMNNAGVMAIPDRRLTKDGYEQTFQTNHLGHFALTSALMPLLATDARIVNVSSLAHLIASKNGLELDNLNGEKNYGPWSSYGQSKLENILFTNELQRRIKNSETYSNKNIMAFSLHPGAVNTDLARYIIGEEKFQAMKENGFSSWQEKLVMESLAKFIKTVQEGASTQIYLAASSEVGPSEAGSFFNDGKVMPLGGFAKDRAKAEELWTVSERLSGSKFDL